MAMSSGDGSKPPRSLNLSWPVTSPVVAVSVGRLPLSTLRYVSGFSGEESLQGRLSCVRGGVAQCCAPCVLSKTDVGSDPGPATCLLEGVSTVSRGSLPPWTALLYVSYKPLEDCRRFMLLPGRVAGAALWLPLCRS